jgi:hypothetical protein
MYSLQKEPTYIIIIITLLLLRVSTTAQTNSKGITTLIGAVADTNYQPIPFTTVQLLANDSAIKYGSICDSLGNFNIGKVGKGIYILKLSNIGYKKAYKELNIDAVKKKIYLPPQILEVNLEQLKEIEVRAYKAGSTQLVDKTIYKPKQSDIENAKDATEILNKAPQIKINKKDDALKVLGNKNVLVLIDGAHNNRHLKSINPKDIEHIEIISHPSAKYRADVGSVVNIVLKDKRTSGLTAYTDNAFALPQNTGKTFNQVSYSYKKVRLFANYHGYTDLTVDRDTNVFQEAEDKYLSYSLNDPCYVRRYNNLQYGLDFSPNKSFLINLTGQLNLSQTEYNSENRTIYSNNNNKVSDIYSSNQDLDINKQQNYSLYLKKTFNDKNTIASNTNIYFQHNSYDLNQTSQDYIKPNDGINESINRNTKSTFEQQSINSKLDYTYKHNKNNSYELGCQLYARQINNSIEALNITSKLDYSDIRNSFYLNNSRTIKNTGVQAGVRIENFNISIYDTVNQSSTQILPYLSFWYKINKAKNIRLSYKQRFRYPNYIELNPYTYYSSDSISSSTGNPNLVPEKNHIINASFATNKDNYEFSFLLGYNYINHIIVETIQTKQARLSSQFNNAGKASKYSCGFSAYAILFDYAEIEASFSLAYTSYYDRKQYNGFSYYTDLSIYTPLFWDIDLELCFILPYKEMTYNGYYKDDMHIDEISISRSFLDNNLTLGFSVWNPFLKMKGNERRWHHDYIEKSNYHTVNSTQFRFNLSYAFSKGKNRKKINPKLNMEHNSKS